jgi:hypothetical protein
MARSRPSERSIRFIAAGQIRTARRYIRIEQEFNNGRDISNGTLAFLRGIIYGVGNVTFRRTVRATDRSWWTLNTRPEHKECASTLKRLAPVQ